MRTAFRTLLGLFVYGATLAVVLAVCALFWGVKEFNSPGPLIETKLVEIPSGSSLAFIAHKLEQEQAIDHALLFQTGVRLLGAGGNLRAGEYEFEPGMSMRAIMDKMKAGKIFLRFLTIPEGLTSYEIVQIINAHPELNGASVTDIPAEGTLLPETYNYMRIDTRENVIKYMKKGMENIKAESVALTPCAAESSPPGCLPAPLKNWNDVVTLASIVEKETGMPEERQRVAGVFLNRLRKGIALQTDPTVIYAITGGKHQREGKGPLGRRLRKSDLEIDSPYNTYKYPGLPPGPIANPGRASIEAVLNPEENDFIYFVADGNGGHVFSRTLDEHNANAARWREIRKARDAAPTAPSPEDQPQPQNQEPSQPEPAAQP